MIQAVAFRPTGALTMHNAAQVLRAGLAAVAAGQREIDLSGLTDTDSAAVAVLLAWQRAARQKSASLIFLHLPAGLHSLVALYDVTDLLAA